MSIIPKTRPQATRAEVESWFPAGTFKNDGIYIVTSRGHFLNTMGKPGENDTKMYDDAVFILSRRAFAGFNANVDPADSDHKDGAPFIQPGIYPVYSFDLHNRRYWAICQRRGAVRLKRSKTGETIHTCSDCGINLHEGGATNVHSEGCMTMPPVQFSELMIMAITEAYRIYGAKLWHTAKITICVRENKAA